jgi:hypothetical protein
MSIETQSDREESSTRSFGRVRWAGFLLVVAATIAFAAVVLRDLLALSVLGWTPAVGTELGTHRLHLMGIAAVVGVVLVGVVAQLHRPGRKVAALLVVLLGTFVATVAMAVTDNPHLVEPLTLFAFAGVLAVLHPARDQLFRLGRDYSPLLLGLVALAAVPLVLYAAGEFRLQATLLDEHALDGHYAMMGTVALTLLLGGVVAAIGVPGYRAAAWMVAALAVYFGALSMGLPASQASGVGTVWGGLTVAWGVAFAVAAELSRRAGASRFLRRPFRGDDVGRPA